MDKQQERKRERCDFVEMVIELSLYGKSQEMFKTPTRFSM